MTSQYPKLLLKMNTYVTGFITYFEQTFHPAAGKNTNEKNKRKSSKTIYQTQASPDCLNIRASLRKQDNIRRNPAP